MLSKAHHISERGKMATRSGRCRIVITYSNSLLVADWSSLSSFPAGVLLLLIVGSVSVNGGVSDG